MKKLLVVCVLVFSLMVSPCISEGCSSDPECDDGLYCNGVETCDTGSGICQPGTLPNCDDGVFCTDDSCNEDTGTYTCANTPNHTNCDDGINCTVDSCHPELGCQVTPVDAFCYDDNYCTGVDYCDAVNDCQSTGNPCTPLGCDEELDVCIDENDSNFCKGNFDYDQDVDGTDAALFKSHFGRSSFKNPCPPDGPAPVEKTHQTTSYATGDDGDHQSGVPFPEPRFVDNEDGTVRDNLTGLTWLKNANCFGQRTWEQAISDSNGLASGACGLADSSNAGDWKLPNRKELDSLIDLEYYDPALPLGHPFNDVQSVEYSADYWTSTTCKKNIDWAWTVRMVAGHIEGNIKSGLYYVWPVRSGH